MRHGSLFSGGGGFDLAAEWAGWENVFHCEKAEKPSNLIKHYWPNSESYDDICNTDFSSWRGLVDIITGGDPCQPHSFAGKRLGFLDERFLWREMLRAAVESSVPWLVNENVEGTITNHVLDQKISDLEREGYTCWPPLLIPANAVGALHRRNRVWLVAYSERNKQWRKESPSRETGRVGRIEQPVAWDGDWKAKIDLFRGMDDGLSNIVDRTDIMRNAIVPQVALQIFKVIDQMNRN